MYCTGYCPLRQSIGRDKLKFVASEKGVLSFQINENDEFIASKNVTRNDDLFYRFAVTMGNMNTCIELL